jgi:hypothetical protein
MPLYNVALEYPISTVLTILSFTAVSFYALGPLKTLWWKIHFWRLSKKSSPVSEHLLNSPVETGSAPLVDFLDDLDTEKDGDKSSSECEDCPSPTIVRKRR